MARDPLPRHLLLAAAGALLLAGAACRAEVGQTPPEGGPALEVQPAVVDTTLPPHQTGDPALDPVMPLPQPEPAEPAPPPERRDPAGAVPRPLPQPEPPPHEARPPAEDPPMPLPQPEPPAR